VKGGMTAADVVAHYPELKAGQVESAMRVLGKVDATYLMDEDLWVTNPHAPTDIESLGIDFSEISERRQREIARLDQVSDFAYSTRCRHASILHYFGEQYDEKTCPGCDRCDDDQTQYQPLSEGDALHVRKALAGVARAKGQFGLTKVAGMLAGSKAKSLQATHLPSLSTYGMLSDLGLAKVTELLQTLVDRGWCSLTGGQYPCLTISEAGWEVMQGRIAPAGLPRHWAMASASASKGPKNVLSSKKNAKRIERTNVGSETCPWWIGLRKFRSAEALRRATPAYVVFSDKTLAEIAERKPKNRTEFLEISGLGTGRWDTYGQALVATIVQLSSQIGE
jgi:ATP-dependent DNA helicase RecQ